MDKAPVICETCRHSCKEGTWSGRPVYSCKKNVFSGIGVPVFHCNCYAECKRMQQVHLEELLWSSEGVAE